MWNDKFEIPDGLYSVSGIQYQIECIIKKQGEKTDNPSVRIYVSKREKRIPFRIKTEYYLELLMPETTKLLESPKCNITKDGNIEKLPHSKITQVVLLHCNIVNNDYQHNSRLLYIFVPNK